jgi:hypothetical protein
MDEVGAETVLPLFEGASDVWRYGAGGLCGFGKKLSLEQAKLMAALLNEPTRKDPTLVLVPDMNDPESYGKFIESYLLVKQCGYSGKVAIAPLPEGSDPAMFSRTVLRNFITSAAELATEL